MTDVKSFLNQLTAQGVKLWLDADQLKVRAPKGTLNEAAKATLRENKAAIMAFMATAQADRIQPSSGDLETSPAQRRLWLEDRLGAGAAYNMPAAFQVRGPLDVARLTHAAQAVVERHRVLTFRFINDQGEPVIKPDQDSALPLTCVDLSALDKSAAQRLAQNLLDQDAATPFHLAKGPLSRLTLLRHNNHHHHLLTNMHHIISDGWSVAVLVRELTTLYAFANNRHVAPLQPLPIQYSDYAAWQNRRDLDEGLNYWRQRLADVPNHLTLPRDYRGQSRRQFRGAALGFELDAITTNALRKLCRTQDASLFMGLFAAFAITLSQRSGQPDVVIGTPAANRDREELEPLIGFFINPLPLRCRIDSQQSFNHLLRDARDHILADFRHADTPFESIVAACQPNRSNQYTPLFQVMLALQNAPRTGLTAGPLRFEQLVPQKKHAKYELILSCEEQDDTLSVGLEYRSDLWHPNGAGDMARHLQQVLRVVLAQPNAALQGLPWVDAAERRQQITSWNDTHGPLPTLSLAQCLWESTKLHADRCAIDTPTGQMTYADFRKAITRQVHQLRVHGVKPGQHVGLHLTRGADAIVALAAIVTCGAVYVPLDPDLPQDRRRFIAKHAQLVAVFGGDVADFQPDCPLLAVHADGPDDGADPCKVDGPACVIYTSGSTGQPKGVIVPAEGIKRLVFANGYHQVAVGERVSHAATLAFDAAIFEIWAPILSGGTCVVLPWADAVDPEQLHQTVQARDIHTLFLTTALFNQAIDYRADCFATLPCVLFGGEAVDTAKVAACLAAGAPKRLLHMYGPTECTTYATYLRVNETHVQATTVPIGMPIGHTQADVVDACGHLVRPPIAGELILSGPGLAYGYLNEPALTAEKFRPDPFAKQRAQPTHGARVYHTGDKVRRDAYDGAIRFVGRVDFQLKLRGYRIEPGEIEACLKAQNPIQDAVVIPRKDMQGDTILVAYVVADTTIEPQTVQQLLRNQLPTYMVPTAIVPLSQLPVNANGKVDRKALPTPDPSTMAATGEPTRTPSEEALLDLWRQFLPATPNDRHANFFTLGGHSLLAVRFIHKVRSIFNVNMPLGSLFEAPTLATFANLIDRTRQAGDQTAPVTFPQLQHDAAHRHEPFPLTDIQQAYWIGRNSDFDLGEVAAHGYTEIDVPLLDPARVQVTMQRLIDRHPMLRAIVTADGQQRILPKPIAYQLPVTDLRNLQPEDRQRTLASLREDLSHQVLPPDRWPLFDLRVTQTGHQSARVHLSIDALIVDARAMTILSSEFFQLARDTSVALPPLPITYRDYVLAEQALRKTALYHQAKDYWLQRLETLPPAPQLPRRQPHQPPRFERRTGELSAADWSTVKNKASEAGVTASGILLAAFAEVLATWSKEPHFTLNLTLFNRLPLHPRIDDVVGDFTSLTFLEVDYRQPDSFAQRAANLQRRLWRDLDHRLFSGVAVQRALSQQRGTGPGATMPVVFTSALALPGNDRPKVEQSPNRPSPVTGEVVYSISQTPQVWLDHAVTERQGVLVFHWDVLAGLFPSGMLDAMFAAYETLLTSLAQGASAWQAPHGGWLVPVDHLAVQAAINDTEQAIPAAALQAGVVGQAKRTPDAIAIIDGAHQITFAAWVHQARNLAAQLQRDGAGTNQLIAIILHKGWRQAVASLAILEAGAAYLPIDPDLPNSRIRYLLDVGEVQQILLSPKAAHHPDWPADTRCYPVQWRQGRTSPQPNAVGVDDLAYVIFTSGSTGQPKGVAMRHRATWNTIADINHRFQVGPLDRVLALSALNFDLSVYDLFGPPAQGAAMVFPDQAQRAEPSHWALLMTNHRIGLWNTVPALLRMLIEYLEHTSVPIPSAPRLILLSGDWIPVDLPKRIHQQWPAAEIISLGGATEAAIWSILYPIDHVDPNEDSIPYGRPMANQQFHILDSRHSARPAWVPGELFIAGTGLADGYWRDAEKTATAFIQHPDTGERLYRTGDWGCYRADGTILFLGRDDAQVKIGGFRIELGEVEHALTAIPQIDSARVIAHGDRHNKQLTAFVVLAAQSEQRSAHTHDQAAPLAPGQRIAFKLSAPGLRQLAGTSTPLPHQEPGAQLQSFLQRQTIRRFEPAPMTGNALGHLLAQLQHIAMPDHPLPKARYASAGSLYPVQVYVHIQADRVDDLPPGYHYYHPREHRLIHLSNAACATNAHAPDNQPTAQSAAFTLFLVADKDAVTPIYGDKARDFCLLEAGYMSQLLMMQAPALNLGLCPLGGLDEGPLHAALQLDAQHELLHSFLGGPVATTRYQHWQPSDENPHKQTDETTQDLSTEDANHNTPIAQLRQALAARLPGYMIPRNIHILDTWPLTANGKIDINALQATADVGQPAALVHQEPRTHTEHTLVDIANTVLDREHISVFANFFELGGDSISATRYMARVREAVGLDLPLTALFERPSVAGLAERIDAILSTTTPTTVQPEHLEEGDI